MSDLHVHFSPLPPARRDTRFAGSAKLVMLELDLLYGIRSQAIVDGDNARYEEYSQRIQTCLAEYAFDVAYHTLTQVPELHKLFPRAKSWDEVMPFVMDMPASPQESEQPISLCHTENPPNTLAL